MARFRLLLELLEALPDGLADPQRPIEEREHEGDTLTREVIDLLNRTFVTPFVRNIPPGAKQQADVIVRAAEQLDQAVGRLDGFRDSSRQLRELRELEDEGDRIVRGAVGGPFRSGQDPISNIRWKELHEELEEAVDACESAADVLEAIVVEDR